MSKPYTEAEFSDQLAQDRGWRLKEISDLKIGVTRADASLQRVMLRALVAICYAHWEGSVKFSAQKYLQHIALRKNQYGDLDRQFLKNYFLPRLNSLSSRKTSVSEGCAFIEEILNASGKKFSHVNNDIVNTKSNLNSDVFRDMPNLRR